MFGFGTTELVVILVIVLIIFGAGKLPEIGGAMGKAIKSFKKSVSEAEIDVTPKEEKEKESIEAGTEEAQKQKTEEAEKQKEQVG
jgi:sec-independent protein translocase protein TatA